MEENKTNENQTENRNQEIFGSNEPKKEESFTMKKATLWKISTLVFAILLAVSWYTGG
jgi:hypothetical protein